MVRTKVKKTERAELNGKEGYLENYSNSENLGATQGRTEEMERKCEERCHLYSCPCSYHEGEGYQSFRFCVCAWLHERAGNATVTSVTKLYSVQRYVG
jgi:hypothetical protein